MRQDDCRLLVYRTIVIHWVDPTGSGTLNDVNGEEMVVKEDTSFLNPDNARGVEEERNI